MIEKIPKCPKCNNRLHLAVPMDFSQVKNNIVLMACVNRNCGYMEEWQQPYMIEEEKKEEIRNISE